MSERAERITEAFNYLRNCGLAHTQKDVAETMKATEASVSNALRGDPKYLTDNFIKRFNNSYDNIFELRWLLLGQGEMLKHGSLMNQNGNGDNHQQGRAGHDLTQTNNSKEIFESFIDALKGQQAIISSSIEQTNRALLEIAEHRKQTDKVLEMLRLTINLNSKSK